MTKMDEIMRSEARLIMLREMADTPNFSLNESLAVPLLDQFGISKSREWIRQEFRYLGDLGAVSISQAGSVMIATATARGLDHVHGRAVLEGVKRPSPREA